MKAEIEAAIKQRYERVAPTLNERTRRLVAASEAITLGWGGISMVSRATGLSRQVISQGIKELQEEQAIQEKRIRKSGGGRKSLVEKDPQLSEDLERLVEPVTRGDPESPLRWTSKSVRKLAKELGEMGHQISHELVSQLLYKLGYSLQANRKTQEGGTHPDRNAQFEHINAAAKASLAAGEPVISVDAKKKELVGDFKNGGREWSPKGEPEEVRVYDFPLKDLGRVTPYGIYDQGQNIGWVNVGIDHDTAAFAVESIRRWWKEVGKQQYPSTKKLLITADGAAVTGRVCACGNGNSSSWPTRSVWASACVIFLRGPASGTKLSIACLHGSVRTGGPSHWSVMP
jgi:transposase